MPTQENLNAYLGNGASTYFQSGRHFSTPGQTYYKGNGYSPAYYGSATSTPVDFEESDDDYQDESPHGYDSANGCSRSSRSDVGRPNSTFEKDSDSKRSSGDSNTKKKRARTSTEQLRVLQQAFMSDPMPPSSTRILLAQKLNMTPRAVQVWFQNRRAKGKLDQKRAVEYSNSLSYPSMHYEQDKNIDWPVPQQPMIPFHQPAQPYPELANELYPRNPSPFVNHSPPFLWDMQNQRPYFPNLPLNMVMPSSSMVKGYHPYYMSQDQYEATDINSPYHQPSPNLFPTPPLSTTPLATINPTNSDAEKSKLWMTDHTESNSDQQTTFVQMADIIPPPPVWCSRSFSVPY